MAVILLIVGIVLFGSGLFLYCSNLRKFAKDQAEKIQDFEGLMKLAIGYLLAVNSSFAFQCALSIGEAWVLSVGQAVLSNIGLFFFFASIILCLGLTYLYNKKPNLAYKKTIFKVIAISICTSIVGFVTLGIGVGDLLKYPLTSGLAFGGGKFISTFNCETKGSAAGIAIAFYGVLIISGVGVVYLICDNDFFKKYGKHGILDAVALLAFPAGIIGARIGYVIGNWNGDLNGPLDGWNYWFGEGHWYKIWEGGLTILGGAIGGILVGVLFVKLRRKYVDLRWGMDVVIPCILIAQAIGRWGNFFNHEVYGAKVLMDDWAFLPNFIKNQMAVGWVGGKPISNEMYVPLFLIESLVNIAGFFVLRYGVGRLIPKYLPNGSLCGGYLIWYGLTRVIMEPLRDPSFNMGTDGFWSNIWAFVYVLLGVLLIVAFKLFDKYFPKKAEAE